LVSTKMKLGGARFMTSARQHDLFEILECSRLSLLLLNEVRSLLLEDHEVWPTTNKNLEPSNRWKTNVHHAPRHT
jgi:hypothetical protein